MNKYSTRGLTALFVFLILTAGFSESSAQSGEKTKAKELKQKLKKDYFSVGSLIQTVFDYQPERRPGQNNGFTLANARFQVYGEISEDFGYQLQANLIKSPAILDGNIYYRVTPGVRAKAGLFKSPFSAEYLTGAASIDFVNRSRVVGELAPKRQIGVQVDGSIAEGSFRYKAGVFNGEGFGSNANADNNFLYAGRIESHFRFHHIRDDRLIVGLNLAYEQKEVGRPGSIRSGFEGKQMLVGGDTRLTLGELMLAGEVIYSRLASDPGVESHPFGYYATAGYFVASNTQVLIRWDRFDADGMNMADDSESVIAGLNYFPTSFSEVQINYSIPAGQGISYSQLLVNLQINF